MAHGGNRSVARRPAQWHAAHAIGLLCAAALLAALPAGAAGGTPPGNNDNVAPGNTNQPANAGPDPSKVKLEWLTPVPEFVAVSPFSAQLKVDSPAAVTRITLDGTEVATPGKTAFTQPIALDPGNGSAAATHKVEIFVDGVDGPFGSTSVSLRLDAEAPKLKLESPNWPEGETTQWNKATAALKITASDNAKVQRLSVNGAAHEIGAGASVSTTVDVNLAQGEQTITIDTADVAGNVVRLERRIDVDSQPPTLEITAPVAGLTAFTTEAARIDLRGVVRDLNGVRSFKVADIDVQLEGASTERSFSVSLGLEEGANQIHCELTDERGNTGTVDLTVIRGGGGAAATAEIPDGLDVPPAPVDTVDVWSSEAAAHGDTPQAAMAALQITALARLVAATWAVRADVVERTPAFREWAAGLHVEFTSWTRTDTGWFCDGQILAPEDGLLELVSANARSLTAADRRPTLPPSRAQVTGAGTVDCIGGTSDGATAAVVQRDQTRVQVAVLKVADGARTETRNSSLPWKRVDLCRMFADGTIALTGVAADGTPQGEFLVAGGTAARVPLPPGGMAWHPTEPRVAGKTPDSIVMLSVPDQKASGKVPCALAARLIGFGPGGDTLIALGTAVDEYGIRVPGTLLVLDAATGEVRSAWQKLDLLLDAAPDLVPPSLDAGDMDAVTKRLDQMVGGRVCGNGSAVLLTLPAAAVVLGTTDGGAIGPVFPSAQTTDRLGGPLQFSITSDGRYVVANGSKAAGLFDPRDGQLLMLAEGATLRPSGQATLIGIVRGSAVTIHPLAALVGAVLEPANPPDVIARAGDTLTLQVRSRGGNDIGSAVRAGAAGPLTAHLRNSGYSLNADGAAASSDSPRVRLETWTEADRIRLRVSVAASGEAPARIVLGTFSVTRNANENDADMHARLFARLRAGLLPVPSRLCRMADAASDLPLPIGGR